MAGPKARRKGRGTSGEPSPRQGNGDGGDAPASNAVTGAPEPDLRGRLRAGLVVLAAVYLITVWLDGVGSTLPARTTPRVWLYFGQIAALFKNAGMMAIDYRAEGWSCADRRWVEIDVRPWFSIDADNKENRFHRALQFYRKERKVMQALEGYVIGRHNASGSGPTIGGVRFLSLRIPYPKLGSHVARVERRPLAAYPEDIRHNWYWTPASRRRERCGDRSPPAREEEDHAPPHDDAKGPADRAPGAAREKEPEP